MSKNLTLTYSREDNDYPNLWLIIPMEEYLENQLEMMRLTPELLKKIVEAAGLKWEYWTEGMIQSLIKDPESQEPMLLLEVEETDGYELDKPMTEAQLDEALDIIEDLDNLRMKEPAVWDFTPMGVDPRIMDV